MTLHRYQDRQGGQPGLHNVHVHLPAPDARSFEEMDAADLADAEAVREIALGLPGRPGVIR